MGNQYWGLGIHLFFISIIIVADTYMCLGAGNITTVACSKQEREALMKFKDSIGYESNKLSSWVGNDCCRWERVDCDGATGYVQGLYLSELSYHGTSFDAKEINVCLGELRHLKYLELSYTYFTISHIPDFFGSLKQLTYLNLSQSYFPGNILPHIGNLSSLKVIDLSYMYTYPIVDDMAWMSGLSLLEHLDLSGMHLSGAKNRDMVLHIVPSLVKLSLSRCGLSNADLVLLLKNSSTTLKNIKHLDLGYNSFYGEIPHNFQNMTSLLFLDLSTFNLSLAWNSMNLLRIIPSLLELHLSGCKLHEKHLSPTHLNLSTLSNIQHLDLSDNLFKGRFPSVLTNMTSLRVLDLSSNYLNSTVPVIPNLLELDLSANSFNQIADVGIWRQCQLKQLTFVWNYNFKMKLTNPTTNVSECSTYALERLILYESVYGTIPESLGRMANLKVLDLSLNELNGTIPKSLGRSRSLEVLDLSHNKLTGPIPTFLGKLTTLVLSFNQLSGSIPESIGRSRLLEVLDLYENRLTGPIPAFVGKLTTLVLSYNQFTGPIPVSIGQLTKLQILDVSNNFLEGVIFEAHLAHLTMLTRLDLSSNSRLTVNVSQEWMPPFRLIKVSLSSCKIADERFPQWLRSQRTLESLNLSDTTISGPLPTWLSKLRFIDFLDLSRNKLYGPLTSLPNGDILREVHLQNNLFNESIPRSLCKSTNLFVLDFSRNRLNGKIPECLGDLQYLKTMIFSSNRLSGAIPSSFGNLSLLVRLSLYNNSFTGKLSQELLSNKAFLTILDLGDNELYGNIPESIGEKLDALVVLRLHKNNFSGRIPPSLCYMSRLRILDVAHNNLTGLIPGSLGELAGMSSATEIGVFDVNGTYTPNSLEVIQVLKGVALEYTTTLKYVTSIDLSSNKLVGEIPINLTALSGLVGLNLSNNHLNGSIPNNIGNMKALFSLDFSGNKLTGTIPTSIVDLNFLSSLNMSHNHLSGRIPTGKQLQTLTDPSIYAGNKDLCGAPLPKNCSSHDDPTTQPRNNYKTTDWSNKAWLYGLDIMSGFATGFWGIIVVLVFKKQWRHNLFMFAEVITDKIYIVVMVRVARMKRRREVM